jgi:rhamnosyltransferase subunit B
MKIILATFGSYGDIQPFLWMGRDLREHGHELLFIANPFFAAVIAKDGFEFCPAGTEEDYHAAATPAATTGNRFHDQGERIAASRRLFTSMFLNPSRDTFEIIRENRTNDTVIIGHSYAYGARLAAEKFSIPFINICLSTYWLKAFAQPMNFSTRLQKFGAAQTTKFIDGQLFTKPFNALRAEVGLTPMAKASNRWMFEGNNLCLFPQWLLDFKLEASISAGFAGFPIMKEPAGELPPAVEEFLQHHGKPVVFTPGSAVTDSAKFFSEALAALGILGKPGIFLCRSSVGIPENLPETVLYADFVPLGLLLGRCSAIVHHGGIGTAAQALASATPQLVCPRMDEQRENARVLTRLGVCQSLPYDKLESAAMAALLGRLTGEDAVQTRCSEVKSRQLMAQEELLNRFVCDCGKSTAEPSQGCQA